MQEAMDAAAQGVAHDLERFLGALGTISAVAPLLGLFGTVIGMIEIFGAAQPNGSSPHALAHGISVALYNTALGLAVAIPALIASRYFRSRVEGFMLLMQDQAQRLLEVLDAIEGGSRAAGSPVQAPAGLPASVAGRPPRDIA
jgi:biopolymer transport protein ExbB